MGEISTSLSKVLANLRHIGISKIMALGVVAAVSVLALGLLVFTLQRPAGEPLYANIDKAELGKITNALTEAGIHFELGNNGTSILVAPSVVTRARLLLAERGLPSAGAVGYEIFDKVGSLGMTSFMQEMTKIRAIEGELARTIQLIRGIKAARVHIVFGDEGSFRRARQTPTASVIVQTDANIDPKFPSAIRHLVASAIPGMKAQMVSIIGSDGTLYASNDDEESASSLRTRHLEQTISSEINDRIRRTLTPFLSIQNFQTSVALRLNVDKRQFTETIFDPNSRVERSVRVVRETQSSMNTAQGANVSVERNIPQEASRQAAPPKQSTDESLRREEVTNYEVSSKIIQSVSGGYSVERISVAVVVNRAALQLPPQHSVEQLQEKLKEIEAIVATSAGAREDRGDTVRVSAVEFTASDKVMEPVRGPTPAEIIAHQSGRIMSYLAVIFVVTLLLMFAVKPALKLIERQNHMIPQEVTGQLSLPPSGSNVQRNGVAHVDAGAIEHRPMSAKESLDQIVASDPKKAARIIKSMLRA